MVTDSAPCASPKGPTTSASPPLMYSGTTTNPNTPRSDQEPDNVVDIGREPDDTPDPFLPLPDEPTTPTRHANLADTPAAAHASPAPARSPSSSSKSSSAGAPSPGHIEPTWPTKIDLAKVSALASWGEGQSLPGLLFDLHWLPPSNKAFFELRASVQLKHAPSRRRDGRTNIFIHIYPERINQLSFDADPADKMLGQDTITLVFALSRPPALVLPPSPCEPKNKASGHILTSLFELARQTSLTLYASVPRRSLSAARFRKLCEAVSEQSACSIAAFTSAATLYQGQGGKVIEGDSLAPSTPGDSNPRGHKVHDDPPQYDESGSAPVYPALDKGKKRLRGSSTPPGCHELKQLGSSSLEDLLHSHLSALEKRFDDALAAHRKEMVELVGQAETRILDTLRREMGEQAAELDDTLDTRLQEEMAELEDTVMRNISEAPLQATLSFPGYPWY